MSAAGVLAAFALGALVGAADACLLRWLARRLVRSLAGGACGGWAPGLMFVALNLVRWGLVLAPAAGLLIGGKAVWAAAYLAACGLAAVVAAVVGCRWPKESSE